MCKCFLRGWSEKQIGKHPQQRNEKPRTSEKKNQHLEKSFGEEKQLCDSLGKHREMCRYPAAGPEEPSAGCSYSSEYESALRGWSVLPSSLHRMFATAESAAEQQRGEKRRKSIKSPSGKKKRHLPRNKRCRWFFSWRANTKHIWQLQNVPHWCWQYHISS